MMEWYSISNIDELDSPALVLYHARVRNNIERAVSLIKDPLRLRPHVKTNKIAEVCRMMMSAGIVKFKAATIAESEMLGIIGAPDVLLAHQPVGPKATRLLRLVEKFPATRFSCIVDDVSAATVLSETFVQAAKTIDVYFDVNVGMNRTGVKPAGIMLLFQQIVRMPSIKVAGLHGYDGHLRDESLSARQQNADMAFAGLPGVITEMQNVTGAPMKLIAGGSPTFAAHVTRDAECSPGTFVFWDWGYNQQFPDELFEYAALVICRVISIVDGTTITTDLGHKSVAAENPLPRVHFLNAPEAVAVRQSEEHLVLEVADSSAFAVGDILYGVPYHICPTVALYEQAHVVEDNKVTTSWPVIARNRKITI